MAIGQVHERGKGSYSSNVQGGATTWHAKDIQAGLSTQIVVQAADATGKLHTIGAIQTLTPTETRPLVRISEVGTDGVIEITPNAAFTIELAVTRLVFDYRRLPAAFARGFRHIHAQRLPFDIVVKDYNPYVEMFNNFNGTGDSGEENNEINTPIPPSMESPNEGGGTVGVDPAADSPSATIAIEDAHTITTRYLNCWLTSYSYTYDQSNYLITENATVWAEAVYDENSAMPLAGEGADLLELFFNQTPESNAMATAFIGGRTQTG